jgi:CRISPR-associated protein Cas5t
MPRLLVVRLTVEAPVTSFRYPHFLVGRQVSYDMPPPSTIYGHVASALGELPAPESFQFGVDFRFVSRYSDLEHQHIITPGGQPFISSGDKYRTSVQAIVQPHLRDFLFKPRMVLYLTRPEWAGAFRSPAFCVVFGRSQDLAAVTSVAEIDLEQRSSAYFEHTLFPFSYRPFLPVGITTLMPRWIEPPPERRAHFDRFIALHHERVFAGDRIESGVGPRLMGNPDVGSWWVDPESPTYHGVQRGVVLHSFA